MTDVKLSGDREVLAALFAESGARELPAAAFNLSKIPVLKCVKQRYGSKYVIVISTQYYIK